MWRTYFIMAFLLATSEATGIGCKYGAIIQDVWSSSGRVYRQWNWYDDTVARITNSGCDLFQFNFRRLSIKGSCTIYCRQGRVPRHRGKVFGQSFHGGIFGTKAIHAWRAVQSGNVRKSDFVHEPKFRRGVGFSERIDCRYGAVIQDVASGSGKASRTLNWYDPTTAFVGIGTNAWPFCALHQGGRLVKRIPGSCAVYCRRGRTMKGTNYDVKFAAAGFNGDDQALVWI